MTSHLNSIDKSSSGDYLISARFTDALYLISGQDGHIIWRLGGTQSDFVMDFNFSRQHDARIISQNETVTELNFLDNAWDGGETEDSWATANTSSLLVVALYTSMSPMQATLIAQYERPDGKHTFGRGSMQLLPSGNYLGGWGDNAYITEHTPASGLVYEAALESDRFANYRAYKFNFTSRPTDWPSAKAFASVTSLGDNTTVVYVSWDGATEVSSWKFYAAADTDDDVGFLIGNAPKAGFETSRVLEGQHAMIFVEALDKDGLSLSKSDTVITEVPLGWHDEDRQTAAKRAEAHGAIGTYYAISRPMTRPLTCQTIRPTARANAPAACNFSSWDDDNVLYTASAASQKAAAIITMHLMVRSIP